MWLVKKPKADGTVEYRNVTSEQRMEFDISRRKEIDALVALGAFKIRSVAESEEFRRRFPTRVIPSMFIDRYGVINKSRLVVPGWEDPEV
eukprot:198619-Heterocapsa_arctica.AAC.1